MMKVKMVFDFDDNDRRALGHHYGEERLGHEAISTWLSGLVMATMETINDDYRQELEALHDPVQFRRKRGWNAQWVAYAEEHGGQSVVAHCHFCNCPTYHLREQREFDRRPQHSFCRELAGDWS